MAMPLSGVVCHPGLGLVVVINLYVKKLTKFEVSLSSRYEHKKGYARRRKWRGLK